MNEEPVTPAPETPVSPTPVPAPEAPKKNNTVLIIVIVAVVVLCCCCVVAGIGGTWLWKNGDSLIGNASSLIANFA